MTSAATRATPTSCAAWASHRELSYQHEDYQRHKTRPLRNPLQDWRGRDGQLIDVGDQFSQEHYNRVQLALRDARMVEATRHKENS
jgi:hypothetical protein